MGRLEEHKLQRFDNWRRRTGNMTRKGIRRDEKTLKAEEQMKRKPFCLNHEKDIMA